MGNHISKCILGGVFLAARTGYNQAFYITSQTRVTLMRQLGQLRKLWPMAHAGDLFPVVVQIQYKISKQCYNFKIQVKPQLAAGRNMRSLLVDICMNTGEINQKSISVQISISDGLDKHLQGSQLQSAFPSSWGSRQQACRTVNVSKFCNNFRV